MLTIAAIGETLWDHYPEHKHLGGSAANFCFHVHQMGEQALLFSRVGIDPDSEEWAAAWSQLGAGADGLQRDAQHTVGSFRIKPDDEGNAVTQCSRDCAFDHLTLDARWQDQARHADAVYFSALGQRSPASAAVIRAFVGAAEKAVKIFEANLFGWNDAKADILEQSLLLSDIVKFNQAEFENVRRGFTSRMDDISFGRYLLKLFDLQLLLITYGAKGSLILSPRETLEHQGFPIKAADSNGCGDAFYAGFMVKFLHHLTLSDSADFAALLAAFVACREGATPMWNMEVLASFRDRMLRENQYDVASF